MRYTVRVAKGDKIENIYNSSNHSDAIAIYLTARKVYGADNVWMADSITELMVG